MGGWVGISNSNVNGGRYEYAMGWVEFQIPLSNGKYEYEEGTVWCKQPYFLVVKFL